MPQPSVSKVVRGISLRVKAPFEKLAYFVQGVVAPLRREGAEISLEVQIQARSQSGIKRDTLEHQVRETLHQIGAEVLEEKEE